MRRYSSQRNGRKGGRPKVTNQNNFKLPNITLVILTQYQYEALLEKYGYKLITNALNIFEEWLKSSPEGAKYRGKNNYGHFRNDGWVINSAKFHSH